MKLAAPSYPALQQVMVLVMQVVALRLRSNSKAGQAALSEEEEMDYSLRMNKELPPDIRVLGWCTVPADFSARRVTPPFL